MGVTSYGQPDDVRSGATSLATWAQAVSRALNDSDRTLDERIAEVTISGPRGVQGWTWRGEWSPSAEYVAEVIGPGGVAIVAPDIVHHDGSAWLAIADSTGVEPGDGVPEWSLVALKGEPTTISVEAETLPVGEAATAVITGAAPAQTIAFGLPTGATGATGPVGPANSLTVTYATGEPGTDVIATITGEAPEQVLDLVVPRGAIGEVSEAELAIALAPKANLVSPALTGSPTAPTPNGVTPTSIATVEYADRAGWEASKPLLSQAAWWVDAKVTQSDRLVDLSGKGRDAVFGAGAAAPIVLPWSGENYVSLYGSGSNYLSVYPAQWTTSVDVTLDMSIGSEVVNHSIYTSGASQAFTMTLIYGTGLLITAPGGASVQTNVLPAFGRHTIRMLCTTTTWTLWVDGAQAGTGSLTSVLGTIGYVQPTGTGGLIQDRFYRATITFDGAVAPQYILDPKNVNSTYTTITNTGTAGGTWVISRTTTGYKTAVVDRPLVLFGGGQNAQGTSTLPNSTDVTVVAAYRHFGTPAVSGLVLDTRSGTVDGVAVFVDTAGKPSGRISGATTATAGSFNKLDGQTVLAGRSSGGFDQFYANGVLLAPTAATWRGIHYVAPRVGGTSPGLFHGEFISAAIFDRVLTDAEIAEATEELLSTAHISQADPHTQYVLESKVGNLLTENQASGTDTLGDTTGFTASGCTATSEASGGVRGGRFVKFTYTSGSGGGYIGGTSALGTIPVVAGQTYTLSTWIKSADYTGGEYLRIYWFTSAGNVAASTAYSAETFSSTPSTWTRRQVTGVAPDNATYASLRLFAQMTVAGERSFDEIGFWAGAGGDWAMPGTPITNLGTKVSHPNVDDVLVQRWDSGLNRWQTVHYDSGLRFIAAADLLNGWTTGGGVYLRRTGPEVYVRFNGVKGGASMPLNPYTLPVGFQISGSAQSIMREGAITGKPLWVLGGPTATVLYGGILDGTSWLNTYAITGSMFGTTFDPLPVSLPGASTSAAPA